MIIDFPKPFWYFFFFFPLRLLQSSDFRHGSLNNFTFKNNSYKSHNIELCFAVTMDSS